MKSNRQTSMKGERGGDVDMSCTERELEKGAVSALMGKLYFRKADGETMGNSEARSSVSEQIYSNL